jgi:hypothetical protein
LSETCIGATNKDFGPAGEPGDVIHLSVVSDQLGDGDARLHVPSSTGDTLGSAARP